MELGVLIPVELVVVGLIPVGTSCVELSETCGVELSANSETCCVDLVSETCCGETYQRNLLC